MTASSRQCDDRRRARVVGRTPWTDRHRAAAGPASDRIPCQQPGEVLVRVAACGVCRTDLHLAEGDLAPHRPNTVPGHEIVGDVIARGERCASLRGRRSDRHRVAAIDLRALCRSAGAAARTCAWRRRSPGGTRTAVMPSSQWFPRTMRTRFPSRSATPMRRRCCVPASSATGRCAAARCRRRAASASTGSARRRISPRRSRCTKAPPCTS